MVKNVRIVFEILHDMVSFCWQDAIYRIKETFNKEFDEIYSHKDREIARIVDRNKRIRKILEDLGLPVEVVEPQMGIAEKPERLLVVENEEVPGFLFSKVFYVGLHMQKQETT